MKYKQLAHAAGSIIGDKKAAKQLFLGMAGSSVVIFGKAALVTTTESERPCSCG